MQSSIVIVFFAAVIACGTSSQGARQSVPILSQLSDAPYPASGYRPSGQLLRLPLRSQQQQSGFGGYVYTPPEVPQTTEATTEEVTTTEMPTTTEPALEQLQKDVKDNVEVEKYDEEGVYYIYHPDGLLQRVVYATRSEDMGYTARLTYKDVEPIKEPIYTYDPQTLVFSKIVA